MIIALSNYWQDNESPGPYCGRKIQITNQGGGENNNGDGKVVVATVEDTCPSCGENDLGIRILSLKTVIVLTFSAVRFERGNLSSLDRWKPRSSRRIQYLLVRLRGMLVSDSAH